MRATIVVIGLSTTLLLCSCDGKTGGSQQSKNQGPDASAGSSPSSVREPELKYLLDTAKQMNEYHSSLQEQAVTENQKRSDGQQSDNKSANQSTGQTKGSQDQGQSKSSQGGK